MEYHKIETLYERDEVTHRLKEPFELKNRVYGALKTWHWDEKIDGCNIRVMWNPKDTSIRFGGRTDNAQIHADLITHLQDSFNHQLFARVFSDESVEEVTLYGEGVGSGIQSSGGIYSPKKVFVLFDVMVKTNGIGWWLNKEAVTDVAGKMGLRQAPYIGEMTLEEATEMVRAGFQTRITGGTGGPAEGLVGRPVECLFDKKGHRLITKLKTKDFAQVKMKDAAFAGAE